MTGPIDEHAPLEDAYGSDDLARGEMTDEELHDNSRKLIAELARRANLVHQAALAGVPGAAEAHVELLVDLALAERAQRTVEKIIRKKREQA